MACEAFIIHLARATSRKEAVEAAVRNVGMPATVMDAVDGQALSDAEVRAWYPGHALFEPRYPFPLGRGEIACFQSHRNAWKEILKRNLDFGIVLEDDTAVDQVDIGKAVSCYTAFANLSDFVSLQTRPLPSGGSCVFSHEDCSLHQFAPTPLRCSGQIIGREAARQLLSVTDQFDRPVDSLLQMPCATGVRVLCAGPSGVSDWPEDFGGSVAQSKARRSFPDRLHREVSRAIYRSRISRMANKAS